jgi:hypothetical protein
MRTKRFLSTLLALAALLLAVDLACCVLQHLQRECGAGKSVDAHVQSLALLDGHDIGVEIVIREPPM